MSAVGVLPRRHHSRSAQAIGSGPLSARMFVGAPPQINDRLHESLGDLSLAEFDGLCISQGVN